MGVAAPGGISLISESAFELLFSEIVAYTGAFVSHSATSHSTDARRASEAGTADDDEEVADGVLSRSKCVEDGEEEGGGDGVLLLKPSPASVGTGNALLPVRQSRNKEL